jgi:hypothetical protein
MGIPEANTGGLKKSDWMLIGCSWLLMQMVILFFAGINNQEEAIKYIRMANHWIAGERPVSLHSLFYSGYISILVLLKWAGLPDKSMYGVQLLLSALSVYYFVNIVRLYVHSRFALVASGILYATCYIIQQWVRVLFTDSIFCSLLIITTYYLLTEQNDKTSKWTFWILLIILPFFRPVGFLFIPVACFHWSLLSIRKNTGKLMWSTAYLAILGVVAYKTFSSESYYYPIHSLHNILGNVLCGYPGDFSKYAKVPYKEGMSVFSYLCQNPEMTAGLFLARFYKIFSMSRPYYSVQHNLLLSVTSLIYYILAVIGIAYVVRRKEKKLYFPIFGILIFSFPMIIFCVEWTGRFSLPVIFYILILSGIGIGRISRYSRILTPAPGDGVRS